MTIDNDLAANSLGVVVRPAKEVEYDAIAEVSVESYRLAGQLDGDSSFYEKHLRDVAGHVDHASVLVALDPHSHEVLGSVTVVEHGSELSEIAQIDELEFRMLAVSPKAQGRGVGRALVDACIAFGRERGLTQIAIFVRSDVAAGALALYDRLGFERMPDRDWWPTPSIVLHALRYPL